MNSMDNLRGGPSSVPSPPSASAVFSFPGCSPVEAHLVCRNRGSRLIATRWDDIGNLRRPLSVADRMLSEYQLSRNECYSHGDFSSSRGAIRLLEFIMLIIASRLEMGGPGALNSLCQVGPAKGFEMIDAGKDIENRED